MFGMIKMSEMVLFIGLISLILNGQQLHVNPLDSILPFYSSVHGDVRIMPVMVTAKPGRKLLQVDCIGGEPCPRGLDSECLGTCICRDVPDEGKFVGGLQCIPFVPSSSDDSMSDGSSTEDSRSDDSMSDDSTYSMSDDSMSDDSTSAESSMSDDSSECSTPSLISDTSGCTTP